MQEKDAGGEILGGIAGLLSRPFIGAGRSGDVRQKIVDTLTRRVNDPLERTLHRAGVGKLIETGARAAAYPVPSWVPLAGRLRETSLKIPDAVPLLGGHGSIPFMGTPEARAGWAKSKADGIVNLIAQHPDAAAFSAATTLTAPIPGITEAYLGTKGLATKALERLTSAPPTVPSAPSVFPSAARFPLPAEPTFLKLPPKIAAAYAEGRKAALEKFAFLLV